MTIQEEFDSYVNFAYDSLDKNGDQYRELRRAFFAGVWAQLHDPMSDASPKRVAECEAFKKAVLALEK